MNIVAVEIIEMLHRRTLRSLKSSNSVLSKLPKKDPKAIMLSGKNSVYKDTLCFLEGKYGRYCGFGAWRNQ